MAQKEIPWTVTLGGRNGWGGLCPSYFDNSYPFYGNKNQASETIDVDLSDPNVLTQGPGIANLTGGTQEGELGSVLITAILKHATVSNVSYACGANKVFKLSSTAVLTANFPKTIDAGTANVADSLMYYQSLVFVFWNDTGVDGDIGLLTNDTTWDPDWGSTVPTGHANLEDAPHYPIIGGTNGDVMFVTNGKYVASYNGTTLVPQALDFWTDAETVSLTWNHNRILIAVNRPNISGSNFNNSGIYTWNGISSTYEGDPIEVSGEIGALYTKNGTTYIWWKDGTSAGGYNLGYIFGGKVEPIRRYEGSLPNQNQVGEHEGLIAWVTDNKVYKWGARDNQTEVKMFHYCSGKSATIGTIAAPFGDLLVSSNVTTTYNIGKLSGYSVAARYKTLVFPVSTAELESYLDTIIVEVDEMKTGAKCDFTITYNKEQSTQALTQIAYTSDKYTRYKILNKSYKLNDFRFDISWANGSATNPVKIRSIFMKGHYE